MWCLTILADPGGGCQRYSSDCTAGLWHGSSIRCHGSCLDRLRSSTLSILVPVGCIFPLRLFQCLLEQCGGSRVCSGSKKTVQVLYVVLEGAEEWLTAAGGVSITCTRSESTSLADTYIQVVKYTYNIFH